jgi:hypothetical protein
MPPTHTALLCSTPCSMPQFTLPCMLPKIVPQDCVPAFGQALHLTLTCGRPVAAALSLPLPPLVIKKYALHCSVTSGASLASYCARACGNMVSNICTDPQSVSGLLRCCCRGYISMSDKAPIWVGECVAWSVVLVYREDSSKQYTEPEKRESQSTHAVSKAVAASPRPAVVTSMIKQERLPLSLTELLTTCAGLRSCYSKAHATLWFL